MLPSTVMFPAGVINQLTLKVEKITSGGGVQIKVHVAAGTDSKVAPQVKPAVIPGPAVFIKLTAVVEPVVTVRPS